MTILFLSRLFYPHIGGVEKHVLEVGKRLVRKGHRAIVVTEEYQSGSLSAKVTGKVDGIEIHRIDAGIENWFKKFRIWWELWKIRELIKTADIVHCHDVFFWYLPFRFLYPKKKVFTTFHGYETKFPPSKKAIFIRKVSEKLSWGNICVGDYIKKWYGTKSDYVTYGAVDLKTQNSKLKTQNHNSKLKILFIGRLEEDTGVLIYLKALEILKVKKIDFSAKGRPAFGWEFEACGDGSLRSKVEQYGKVNGFVNDLNQYIEKADMVFASSYLSILQALAQEKLVIAVYNNPLKEDYLKMSPFAKWIVIGNSPKNLADKILYFMNHDDEKEKMIRKAYEWSRTQTWDNVVDLYSSLWKLKNPRFKRKYTGSSIGNRYGIGIDTTMW